MRFLLFAALALLATSANAKSSRKRKKKQESDAGMRIAKMIDNDKDQELSIKELRNAPEDVTKKLNLSGFKLVDKLKIMNKRNPVSASLSQAAKYFNKVLEARAAGLPLEEDIKKEEQEEDSDDMTARRRDEERSRTYVKPQHRAIVDTVDRNGDGVISHEETALMFNMIPQDKREGMPQISPKEMHKAMDTNSDDEVTIGEFAAFWDMFTKSAAFTNNPYMPRHTEL